MMSRHSFVNSMKTGDLIIVDGLPCVISEGAAFCVNADTYMLSELYDEKYEVELVDDPAVFVELWEDYDG